jgi:hypothetical protein
MLWNGNEYKNSIQLENSVYVKHLNHKITVGEELLHAEWSQYIFHHSFVTAAERLIKTSHSEPFKLPNNL